MGAETCENEPDGCVVETAPLSAILRDFVSTWRRDRPSLRGRRTGGGAGGLEPVGPYEWLADDTGLTEDALRKIRNPRRQPFTELRVADALVASIGEPCMFADGTLHVIPNPRAALERRAECCGGSTPDSLTG